MVENGGTIVREQHHGNFEPSEIAGDQQCEPNQPQPSHQKKKKKNQIHILRKEFLIASI